MAGTDYAVRHCTGCGKDLPLTSEYFYPAKESASGFRFRCIACSREEAKIRQQKRLANPDVYAATLQKNKERARKKRGPRPPVPTEKACTSCGAVHPATSEFFSPQKSSRTKVRSTCKACNAKARREKRARDPEERSRHVARVARYQRERMASDPEFRRRVMDRANAAERRRRADPVAGEKERARDREWYHANPDRIRQKNRRDRARLAASQMLRSASKLRATPLWAETERIRALYSESRRLTLETGIKHNVDHIVPLRGRTVCGLHVFANLRIVTEFENKSKSNKLIEALAA